MPERPQELLRLDIRCVNGIRRSLIVKGVTVAKSLKQLVTDLADTETLFNDFREEVQAGPERAKAWHDAKGYDYYPKAAVALASTTWEQVDAIRDRRDRWEAAGIPDTLKAQMV
jgi:hypothetical protein